MLAIDFKSLKVPCGTDVAVPAKPRVHIPQPLKLNMPKMELISLYSPFQ